MSLFLRSLRTSQPQGGGIELDRASGWSHAILAGRLINGQAVSPYDPRPTPKGVANRVYMPAGTVSPLGIPKSASWSILFAGVPVGTGPYQYVLGCVGSANAFALALRHDSFSGRATFFDGATAKDSGINVVNGIYTTIGVTFDALTGTISWCKDGTLGLVQTGAVDVGGTGWQYCAQPGDSVEMLQTLLAFANKPLSSSAMLEATANPWQLFKPVSRSLWIPGAVSGGGVVNYTLSAVAGGYSVSSNTATLSYAPGTAHYTLTAAAGSYAIGGNAATLTYAAGSASHAYTLTAAKGSYSVIGMDASFAFSGAQKGGGIPRKKFQVETAQGVISVDSLAEASRIIARAKKAESKPVVTLQGIKVAASTKKTLDYKAIEARMRAEIQAEIDDEEDLLMML